MYFASDFSIPPRWLNNSLPGCYDRPSSNINREYIMAAGPPIAPAAIPNGDPLFPEDAPAAPPAQKTSGSSPQPNNLTSPPG
jgi:hypothetical protein